MAHTIMNAFLGARKIIMYVTAANCTRIYMNELAEEFQSLLL